jgi:hypothetical protein
MIHDGMPESEADLCLLPENRCCCTRTGVDISGVIHLNILFEEFTSHFLISCSVFVDMTPLNEGLSINDTN